MTSDQVLNPSTPPNPTDPVTPTNLPPPYNPPTPVRTITMPDPGTPTPFSRRGGRHSSSAARHRLNSAGRVSRLGATRSDSPEPPEPDTPTRSRGCRPPSSTSRGRGGPLAVAARQGSVPVPQVETSPVAVGGANDSSLPTQFWPPLSPARPVPQPQQHMPTTPVWQDFSLPRDGGGSTADTTTTPPDPVAGPFPRLPQNDGQSGSREAEPSEDPGSR